MDHPGHTALPCTKLKSSLNVGPACAVGLMKVKLRTPLNSAVPDLNTTSESLATSPSTSALHRRCRPVTVISRLSPPGDATPLFNLGTEFQTRSLAARGAASGGATALKPPGLNALGAAFALGLGLARNVGFDRPAGFDRAFGFVRTLDLLTTMAED